MIDITRNDIDASQNQNPFPQTEANLGNKVAVPTVSKIPINFLITAKSSNTRYSILLQSSNGSLDNSIASYQLIKAGEPNYFNLSDFRVICLNGYLRN